MTASVRAFDEIADFFAANAAKDLIAFRPSQATSDRVELLVNKEKANRISAAEKEELDTYMVLEHIMRLAKAKAKKFQS